MGATGRQSRSSGVVILENGQENRFVADIHEGRVMEVVQPFDEALLTPDL